MHDIKQLRLSHNKFRHLKKKPGGFADSSFSRCYAESKLCIQYTKAKAKIQAALKKLAGDWFNFSSAPEFFKDSITPTNRIQRNQNTSLLLSFVES